MDDEREKIQQSLFQDSNVKDLYNVPELLDDNNDLVQNSNWRNAIAVDCEMVDCETIPASAVLRPLLVSVGIVDFELENLFYARVAIPDDALVVDDCFARTIGKLTPNWNRGLRLSIARSAVKDLVMQSGILVGWQIDSDLSVLTFSEAADAVRSGHRQHINFDPADGLTDIRIVDLCDHFRCVHGGRCQLLEAHRKIFDRHHESQAHNATDDSRMVMELYRKWHDEGCPAVISLCLSFYIVNIHKLKSSSDRYQTLWDFLRPERCEKSVMLEYDDGRNLKIKFREENERSAYISLVRRRLHKGGEELGSLHPTQAMGKMRATSGLQYRTRFFSMHIYEVER